MISKCEQQFFFFIKTVSMLKLSGKYINVNRLLLNVCR